MKNNKQLGGLDYFKLAAALLVVAIHTSPLASINANADFILTRVIARMAVPFFLMVTGYFLLPPYVFDRSANHYPLRRFIKKALLLYAGAIIVYLPINFYAGHFKDVGIWDMLRMLLFDGTFYHLWYLPASVLGVWLIYVISRRFPFKAVAWIAVGLYCIGLFGDSYFGIIEKGHVIRGIYDAMFHIFSYTRNGIFYAPVFLLLGAGIGRLRHQDKRTVNIAGFLVSAVLMITEGLVLHHFGMQRHDSMYVALLPSMYFLFQIILSLKIKDAINLRTISTLIYLVHPLVIVITRGAAKVVRLEAVLIDNSVCFYLTVCIVSCIFSVCAERLLACKRKQRFLQGRAWIELNREHLHNNVTQLQSLLPPGCRLMPAVKADAYGHGAVLVSKELNALGVKSFCVASVEEGVQLRRHGVRGEILILGYTHPEQFSLLRRYHLTQTIIDYSYAEVLNAYERKIKVHLKIDTGMHRLGERSDRITEIVSIFRFKHLLIEGVYTHLCAADTMSPEDKDFTESQAAAFYEVISQIKKSGYACPKIHLQASAGLLNYPELSGDYARIGIALYGVLSNRIDMNNSAAVLHPVLSVKARVVSVKDLFAGEAVGYGLEYVAEQDMKIAAVAIGYADGLPRSLSCGMGYVLINGCQAPMIGHICMDQTVVDISNVPDVEAGDVATIIGTSGQYEITAYHLAEQTGTITNEILSRLGSRLDRIIV